MFKGSLLATTALVLAASVAYAANEHRALNLGLLPGYVPAPVSASLLIGKTNNRGVVRNNTPHDASGAIFSNFSKDKNAEFISWYGFTAINYSSTVYGSSSMYKFSEVGFNAVPFAGTGKAPKSVTIPGLGYASTYEFEGVIMSSVAGLPGDVIATTSATTWSDTALCCTAARTVHFSGAPKLEKGKQYFVGVECANSPCDGGWNMEDTDFSGNAVDYWHYKARESYTCNHRPSCHSYTQSYSSPWHLSNSIPSAGAVIIK